MKPFRRLQCTLKNPIIVFAMWLKTCFCMETACFDVWEEMLFFSRFTKVEWHGE
jgi:hypothetical protein